MKLAALLPMAAAVAVAVPTNNIQSRDGVIPSIDDQKFISAVMDAHWYWRRIHCAQDLTWDPKLAQAALDSVNGCTHNLQHDRGGSNLSGTGPPPETYDVWIQFAHDAVHGWHEEESKYPYSPNPKWDAAWGHFSQMVWRDSSRIGCALANCESHTDDLFPGRIYCFYERAGNNIAQGEFEKNVWPPVCADPTKAEMEARYHS